MTDETAKAGKGLPAYCRIAENVRDKILSGALALRSQLPSEHELRQQYGVSRVTVRGALKKLQAEGLIRRVNGIGTFVSFVPERGRRVLLVLEDDPGKIRHLHELVMGAIVEAQQGGFNVLVLPYGQLRRQLEETVARPADHTGVLLLRCRNFRPDDIRYAEKHGIPCLLEGTRQLRGHNWLAVDNEGAMRRMVDHLHGLGRKQYGIFTAEAPYAWSSFRERQGAASRRLAALGIRKDNVATVSLPKDADLGSVPQDWTARFFEYGRRPDAIICVNDVIAIQVLRWLGGHGIRVPEDVAVTGFDDIVAARYAAPPLTTVKQAYYEVGGEAMRQLRGMMDDAGNRRVRITRKLELVLRESTVGGLRSPDPSPARA